MRRKGCWKLPESIARNKPDSVTIEDNTVLVVDSSGVTTVYDIGSREAFGILSDLWLRSGWDTKYVYSFSWLGRPIIQLPDDLVRIQELVYRLKPDVIIETGVAHGGSLVFFATLCKALNRGKVIGVDVEIRAHNRKALEEHELCELITLIEGNSIDEDVVSNVRKMVRANEQVLVVLDSNHSKQHVLSELEAYAPLVSVGSYIVAEDGIMAKVAGAPRSQPDWDWNNPESAVREFVRTTDSFVIDEPGFFFNEGLITERVTYWPSAFLRRVK